MWLRIVFVFVSLSPVKASDVGETSTFLALFDGHTKTQIQEIYQVIPGSLMKFLEKKDIVRPISFRSTFGANGVGMGTDEITVMHNFNKYLRESIESQFDKAKITEIRPEDLSLDITDQYKSKLFHRLAPGQTYTSVMKFNKIYKGKEGGPFRTAANAYVYMEIVERCEANWIAANERRFDYHIKIEISGLSINQDRVNRLREKIDYDGIPKAIDSIRSYAQISWDDL